MSESMVERVRQAIVRGVCKSCGRPCVGHGGGRTPDCDRNDCCWREATDQEQARAAIEAMREPTAEMVAAVDDFDVYWGYEANGAPGGNPGEVFSAMIDAALSPAKVDEASR